MSTTTFTHRTAGAVAQLPVRPTNDTSKEPATGAGRAQLNAEHGSASVVRPVRSWPVLLLALPAFVAVWSGWVGLGDADRVRDRAPAAGHRGRVHDQHRDHPADRRGDLRRVRAPGVAVRAGRPRGRPPVREVVRDRLADPRRARAGRLPPARGRRRDHERRGRSPPLSPACRSRCWAWAPHWHTCSTTPTPPRPPPGRPTTPPAARSTRPSTARYGSRRNRTVRKPAARKPARRKTTPRKSAPRKLLADYVADARDAWSPGTEVTPAWVRSVTDCARGTSKAVADTLRSELPAPSVARSQNTREAS